MKIPASISPGGGEDAQLDVVQCAPLALTPIRKGGRDKAVLRRSQNPQVAYALPLQNVFN